jgi:hypothetical protein
MYYKQNERSIISLLVLSDVCHLVFEFMHPVLLNGNMDSLPEIIRVGYTQTVEKIKIPS